jgi:hypothetical protein
MTTVTNSPRGCLTVFRKSWLPWIGPCELVRLTLTCTSGHGCCSAFLAGPPSPENPALPLTAME